MGYSLDTLLQTKLFIPRSRGEQVLRRRLVQRLDEGLSYPLLLLSAQAGCGKTTALTMWVEQLAVPTAWLSLDDGDNDAVRFFTYVFAALRRMMPDLPESLVTLLRARDASSVDVFLLNLVNEISTQEHEMVLVLDDYHVIQDVVLHQTMSWLVEHMPPCLHLVIATRSDPPLPLARLRANGLLQEIRAADLRFTCEETDEFLRQVMNIQIPVEDVRVLEERTEGWAVGLQLAGLSLRNAADTHAFITSYSGEHHFVLDYLVQEVLRRQTEQMQQFLLYTSILRSMCTELVYALLHDISGWQDESYCRAALNELEENNLFVVALDDVRGWYRYHHLFADVLAANLERLHQQQVAGLHDKASRWYEEQGMISEAIRHSARIQDWPRMVTLVEHRSSDLLYRGEFMTVIRWLKLFPQEVILERAWLCLFQAWVLVFMSRIDDAEQYLETAQKIIQKENIVDDTINAHILAIRTSIAKKNDDRWLSIRMSEQALASLPEDDAAGRCLLLWQLGSGYLRVAELETACRLLAEAGSLGKQSGNIHSAVPALCALAVHQMALGNLGQAQENLQEALRTGTSNGEILPVGSRAYCELSQLSYEWNEVKQAEMYARQSIPLALRWGMVENTLRVYPALAQALLAQGDAEGARQAMQSAEDLMQRHELTLWAEDRLQFARVNFWLAGVVNDLPSIERWVAENKHILQPDFTLDYMLEMKHMALARALVALERFEDALKLLDGLQAAAAKGGRNGRLISILALRAAALQGLVHTSAARDALWQALQLGQAEGFLRSFVDTSPLLAEVLAQFISDHEAENRSYAVRVLAAFGIGLERSGRPVSITADDLEPEDDWLPDALSQREVDVLRCMAEGLSNDETAARLYIATGTVKRHVNSIFRKLGVSSRTRALVKARQLGLL